MKYLIILLLLSVQGFGQNNIYRTTKVRIQPDTFPYQRLKPVAQLKLTPAPLLILPENGAIECGPDEQIYITVNDRRRPLKEIIRIVDSLESGETVISTGEDIKLECGGVAADSLVIDTSKLHPEALRRIAKEAAIRTDEKVWGTKYLPELSHTHKWVELHQDTVEVVADNRGLPVAAMVPSVLIVPKEYTESIPLICLICHAEKKKIIHYKREK